MKTVLQKKNNIPNAYIDTDVIIRLLTGDDQVKMLAAKKLFLKVERQKLILHTPDSVIADAVFVLGSPRLYKIPREEIRELLLTLISLPCFEIENRQEVIRALDIFALTHLDFGDALLAASVQMSNFTQLISYDHDFDQFDDIERTEP